jgi:hypothetical protein
MDIIYVYVSVHINNLFSPYTRAGYGYGYDTIQNRHENMSILENLGYDTGVHLFINIKKNIFNIYYSSF